MNDMNPKDFAVEGDEPGCVVPKLFGKQNYSRWKEAIDVHLKELKTEKNKEGPIAFFGLDDETKAVILEMNLEDLNCENGLKNLYNRLDEIFEERDMDNDADKHASQIKQTPENKPRKKNRKKNKQKNVRDVESLNENEENQDQFKNRRKSHGDRRFEERSRFLEK